MIRVPNRKNVGSKRATLKIGVGSDLAAIRANRGRPRQVILNLVTNASEAIAVDEGHIHLDTGFARVADDTPAEPVPVNYGVFLSRMLLTALQDARKPLKENKSVNRSFPAHSENPS
jgi:hypothetical protein